MRVNNPSNKITIIVTTLLTVVFLLLTPKTSADQEMFCDNLPRPAYDGFQKDKTSTRWFEVYQVEPNIWAIYEPYQWQEVISYLIIGSKSALLFDTGNGIDNIKSIVDRLTNKPITVLNSHSHFDHIGGNNQFKTILSPSTEFSITNSKGNDSEMIKTEVSADALCIDLPDGVTSENHRIKPYTITSKVKDGDIIDLGNRQLKILHIPGHTDDSIALLDKKAGFLWTGDSFYEGPIWLYFPETDLAAYQKSLARLVKLVPQLNALFPAHNTPKSEPSMLIETQKALEIVFQGKAKSVPAWEGAVTFEFNNFGFLIREDYTTIYEKK